MNNKLIDIKTYYERAKKRRDELYKRPEEFGKKLAEILNEAGVAYSEYQMGVLTQISKESFPLIQHMPAHAKALDVSIGYLIGQHDITDIKTERAAIDLRYEECDEAYKAKNSGHSLLYDKIVQSQWSATLAKGEKTPSTARPYIRIADALEWDIDYVLGVRDMKSWKYYCIDNDMLEALPENVAIVFDGELAILRPDKKGFMRGNGKTVSAKTAAKKGYAIISRMYPL